MQKVKLHGCFRSGTNYVKGLLELNWDVQLVATHGGWKHAPVPALFGLDHGWPLVGVVRDPWVWLDSFFRHTKKQEYSHIQCAGEWRSFVTAPLHITHATEPEVPTYRYASPVEYWNAMAENLLSVTDRGPLLRYEDVLRDPEGTCQRVAGELELHRISSDFVDLRRRVRNMVDRPREELEEYVTEVPFDKASALRPRRSYDFITRRRVRQRLDEDLLDRLGYADSP